MNNKALHYGNLACKTMMAKFDAPDLPPKGGFHYHQGVFLSGMMHLYDVCGDERYFDYMKQWVDSYIPEPGIIRYYQKGSLDDYMAGILLFPLYERTKDEKYLSVLQMMEANLRNWCRNSYGGFWHKEYYTNQMWLDGLYMAGPLQMMMDKLLHAPRLNEQAVEQVFIMYDHMHDEETNLLYHAWDPSFVERWATKPHGLSEEFWGRALGWYVVAVLDIMEQMDKEDPRYEKLAEIERKVLGSVLGYQSEGGAWYQVVNKGHLSDNWIESSCSCLFTYASAKAYRMGLLGAEALEAAKKGFEAVIREFITVEDEKLTMSSICVGTGVMQYAGYIARPTSENDLHGMGAFLLMCAEIAKIKE